MVDYLIDEAPELEYPYFSEELIRDYETNIFYRNKIHRQCDEDVYFRQEILRRCAADSLYWLSTFCHIFEPRPRPQVIPMIPWPHQIPVWKEMERWMGVRDVGLEKSRGEGASWMIVLLCLHKFLFMELFSAGFVSKDEDTLDNADDPGSLMGKFDFCLGNTDRGIRPHLPNWMIPRFNRIVSNHTFTNEENGATLTGYTTTANVGTGSRKTCFVLDELAKFSRGFDQDVMNSTFPVTDCRYLISSPYGPDGAYYEAMHKASNMIKCKLHWTANPVRNQGMYKVQVDLHNNRRVKILDHEFWKNRAQRMGQSCQTAYDVELLAEEIKDESKENPFKYSFMMFGDYVKHELPRSPWYDVQCQRPNQSPTGISQELDIDYGGATSRFFDGNMLIRLQSQCEPPLWKGELILPDNPQSHRELSKCRCEPSSGGRILFWRPVDDFGKLMISHVCVLGADVSAGTSGIASSNSTFCILDRLTGDQIAAFAGNNLGPERFAEYAVAAAYFFSSPDEVPAMMIWEANGTPGGQFGQRLTQLGYPHLYQRETMEEFFTKETRKLGYWTNNITKPRLLGEFRRALDRNEVTIYDHDCLEEAKYYVNLLGGKIEHIAAVNEKDPAAAQLNHGDRVIGAALAWHVAKDYVLSGSGGLDDIRALEDLPENCAIARRRRAMAEKAAEQAWVPPSQRRRVRFR